jgi:bifunctional UDP-N-acetylglucosamine pyrophosphorylase / glucosamine-1-phosphate N-acetyltransferase
MTDSKGLAAVVMAGGLGTRMRSETPKHLHALLGRRMVDWALDAVRALEPDALVLVCSPEIEAAVAESVDGARVAVQPKPRGTGDAVLSARTALDGFAGDVLVVPGDAPLLTGRLLRDVVAVHRREAPALTLVTVEPETPRPYGRVVRDDAGAVTAIVEATDATPEQLEIRELNASIYVFSAPALWRSLEAVRPDNAQGELYLTDAVAALVAAGDAVVAHRAPEASEADGVNTRAELAEAAAVLRDRINARHMDAGATLLDPATTWIDADVVLEADVVIEPFTVLRGGTRVRRGAVIGSHAVVVDAEIGERASVGPFCYVRPGAALGTGAKAGTFVEIKNSRIGDGAKVPHLSYIGDADVGEGTNVGAGTITANFPHEPGRPKGRTAIGRNVRVGVHDTFVAPVTIGDDAWIAAGSVITEDVPPGSLAGFPPRQVTKEGYLRGERHDD